MAAGGPVRELSEEVTCPICLEFFRDPVILPECGHNFCRVCLAQSWGEAVQEASCPVCKQSARRRDLRPNRQLANVVEIAKKLSLQEEEARKEGRVCGKHQEPLKLFCRTDDVLVCTVCDRSKEHRNHEVLPAEEAAQEYKDKIFSCLETLRTEREKILKYIVYAADESREILKTVESERRQAVAEFRTLHQLLNEHEKDLLAKIEEAEKEIARKRDEHLARLSEELSSLENLIREIEEKQQQPVNEFLQDVRGTLQRCEKKETFEDPEAFLSELRWRACECSCNRFLKSAMKQCKDALAWAFPNRRADVTLDPASASSCLVQTWDRKQLRWRRTPKELSEDPEECYGFALGSEGFTAGCQFWEVLVGRGEGWAVGVARKPVKGRVTFTPEEGIWAVGRWKGQYKAFIKGTDPPLTLREEPEWIRVCLNCDGGQVAFFDADRGALLYEFSGASFCGETLHPFFAVYGDGWLWVYP